MGKSTFREMSRLAILIRRRALIHTAIRELDRYAAEKRTLIRWWGAPSAFHPFAGLDDPATLGQGDFDEGPRQAAD
jgi:hypothetical protein